MKKLVAAAIFTALMTGTALADTTLKLVEVITSPERTETLKGIVSKFETANPGTKVEIISLPWSEAFQKFATMVSAGDVPMLWKCPIPGCRSMPIMACSKALSPILPSGSIRRGSASARLNSAAT